MSLSFICFFYAQRDRGIARVCAAAAAAAAVVEYSLRPFPHRDRCLPPLLLLFTRYAVDVGVTSCCSRT